MSKLRPISLSSPTGTNSVVLKMNAASASATTLSQRPLAAVASILVMRVIEPGEMQGGEPAARGQQHSRDRIAESRTAPGREAGERGFYAPRRSTTPPRRPGPDACVCQLV